MHIKLPTYCNVHLNKYIVKYDIRKRYIYTALYYKIKVSSINYVDRSYPIVKAYQISLIYLFSKVVIYSLKQLSTWFIDALKVILFNQRSISGQLKVFFAKGYLSD